jgi:NADPH:quinone reductase-like Zn-dependent oxidoreductase
VWVYQAQHQRRFGTAAEYVAIEACRAVPLPDEASFEEGACLGIPAMTAHRCVFADGPVAGQTVLVTGGAGRVAGYAIQWAAQAGARVIATASNEADEDFCRRAGALEVVNHRQPGWAEQVLRGNGGARVDRVIEVDFGANLPALLEVIRTGGTIATDASMGEPQPRLPFYRMMYLDLTVRWVIVYDMPESAKQQAAEDIDRALRSGALLHRISHRLPLAETAWAHRLVEDGGSRGCVVLKFG